MSQIIHQAPTTVGELHLYEYSGGIERGMMVQIGQFDQRPVTEADRCGFIQLTKEEARNLAYQLLAWTNP